MYQPSLVVRMIRHEEAMVILFKEKLWTKGTGWFAQIKIETEPGLILFKKKFWIRGDGWLILVKPKVRPNPHLLALE